MDTAAVSKQAVVLANMLLLSRVLPSPPYASHHVFMSNYSASNRAPSFLITVSPPARQFQTVLLSPPPPI